MQQTTTKLSYRIRLAQSTTDEEVRDGTKVLCEAFNWSFFTFALDNDKNLVPELLGAYLKAGLLGGQVYFAENEKDDIVGVAIWFPPGRKCFDTPEQTAAGWDALMAKLSQKCSSWWPKFLGTYDQFVEDSLGEGFRLASYHLQLIGILPDYQQKGIGTAMLAIVEKQARSVGKACVLETASEQRATVVYKALGYEIKGISDLMDDTNGKPAFRFYVLTKP